MGGCSAYLSVYEDWEFLRPSMESICKLVDEIVVVDGAYAWMAGFLRANGKDPARSGSKVRDALAGLGVPVRIIEGVWADEFEKRAAGFAACAHRYVFRVDADEIVFADAAAIEAFIDGGQAVAEMEIPAICHSPDWVEAVSADAAPARVGFLFDTAQIHPMDHLRYLWIESQHWPAQVAAALPPVAAQAVARTAHLTTWRSPEGARNRAAFYNLAYIRNHGCPWLPELAGSAVPDLDVFFARAAPVAYGDSLLFGAQCCSDFDFAGKILAPSPFSAAQREAIRPHYEFFRRSHVARNHDLSRAPHWFLQGQFVRIDLSTAPAQAAIAADGVISIGFSHAPHAAAAELHLLHTTPPYARRVPIPIGIQGRVLRLQVPAALLAEPALRRLLRFQIWTREFDRLQQFVIQAPPAKAQETSGTLAGRTEGPL